jgi:hypothetical protein
MDKITLIKSNGFIDVIESDIEISDDYVDMEVIKGVAQGDPNGPPTYVNGYGRVLDKIEETRRQQGNNEMEMAIPEWWETKRIGGGALKIKTAKNNVRRRPHGDTQNKTKKWDQTQKRSSARTNQTNS